MKKGTLANYRREKLGFVFQFYNLVPNLTVKENIEVGWYLSKKPLPLNDLLNTLGLWEHKDKFPAQLSGGQQQRCAIGRALIKNPAILLCDEPTGALDYNTSKEILSLLESIHKEYGTTMILVTHNEAITGMATRIMKSRDGAVHKDYKNENPIAAADIEW
jgi:putative ABC transport system ATP-binding protein